VVESSSKESYASTIMQFRNVCKNSQKFLNYVECAILDTVKEWHDIVKAPFLNNRHDSIRTALDGKDINLY